MQGVAVGVVEPFTASNGFVVAIAHAGLHSVDDMFENETTEQYYLCKWARAGALLGGLIWAGNSLHNQTPAILIAAIQQPK